MFKCSVGACRLTSIKGACQTSCSQQIGLLTVYYTVEIALTTSSQFMTFSEPIQILADFAP